MSSIQKPPVQILSEFFQANKIQRSQISDAVPCVKNPGELILTLRSTSVFGPVPQHTIPLGDARRAREGQLAIRDGSNVEYHKPVHVTPGW